MNRSKWISTLPPVMQGDQTKVSSNPQTVVTLAHYCIKVTLALHHAFQYELKSVSIHKRYSEIY